MIHGARSGSYEMMEGGRVLSREPAVDEKLSCIIPRIKVDFRIKLTSAFKGPKRPCAPHASRSAYEGKMSQ
jgi:hypothetical protein